MIKLAIALLKGAIAYLLKQENIEGYSFDNSIKRKGCS
jgi:hypothetical protein